MNMFNLFLLQIKRIILFSSQYIAAIYYSITNKFRTELYAKKLPLKVIIKYNS